MKITINQDELNEKTANVIYEIFKDSITIEENSRNSIKAENRNEIVRNHIVKKYGQDCYAKIHKKTKNIVEEYLINQYYSHKFEPYFVKIKNEIERIIEENQVNTK